MATQWRKKGGMPSIYGGKKELESGKGNTMEYLKYEERVFTAKKKKTMGPAFYEKVLGGWERSFYLPGGGGVGKNY